MRVDSSIAVFVLISMVSIAVSPANVCYGQTGSVLEFASAENGIIAVHVETSSGQFRIEAADGTPLLFSSEKGVTGFTNIHLLNNTYTTNVLHRPATPTGSRSILNPRVEELADRVRLSADLIEQGDTVVLQQDFIPSTDGDYAYINIVTTLRNNSDHVIRAGSMLMHDIMIGDSDLVHMTVGGTTVTHEQGWQGASIPDMYEADVSSSAFRIRGRLASATADRPDMFVAGNWRFHGYLGTAVWDYDPSGLEITDNAVLLRWNDADIPARSSRTVRTDYGFLATTNVTLTCDVPELLLSEDSSYFTPWPIPATATITNVGALPVSNLEVEVDLPPQLQLMPGEQRTRTIPGPLDPGNDVIVTWLLDADTVQQDTRVTVDFRITQPTELLRQCSDHVVIPQLTAPTLALDCGDTIRLARHPEGNGYSPDPFSISVYVENTGTTAINNLMAELQLPPGVVLVSGSAVQSVSPDPLQPGSATVIDWVVRGIVQQTHTVASYTVRVFNSRMQTACENAVIIPPISQEPCIEAGVSTAGKEFWLGFLPDASMVTIESLRLHVSAPEQSTVFVQDAGGIVLDSLHIPAGGMRMLEVDAALNDYQEETPVRNGLRLISDNPVHVFAGNFRDRHTDAYTVLPDHALGTRYITAGYNWADATEHFCILASEDQTVVRITPSTFTSTGRPGGQTFTVSLDAGELYYVRSFVAGVGGSLTGSQIEANKPVAVLSGAETGWVPEQGGNPSGFLNPLAEQMIPLRYLGTEYVLAPFRSRYGGDTYRIVAAEDSTQVTVGGASPLLLHPAGMWVEDLINNPVMVRSDKPVMVAHYANSALWDDPSNEYGDGSMMLEIPTDRFMSCHYFPAGTLVADVDITPNIAAETDDVSWLEVRGAGRLETSVFTVECWMQPLMTGVIVSRTSGNDAVWKLEYDMLRARVGFRTERPGYGSHETSRDNSLLNGRWVHCALVVDGPAGTATVYLGGTEVLMATFSPTDFQGEAGLAWGGVYGDPNDSYFIGQFDECRFWDGKRTPEQIRASMSSRLSILDRAGLLGYWTFCNDYEDETLYGHDLTPRGNVVQQDNYFLASALNCSDQLDSNFVNLVMPTGSEQAVTVNFSPLSSAEYSVLPGTGYSLAQLWLPTGITRIETSDPSGVGAGSYGFAYHDAYTTYTGFRVQGGVQTVRPPLRPTGAELHAPWPQPAHGDVRISYSLAEPSSVHLRLHDINGRELRTLASGLQQAGRHQLMLSTTGLSAGTYLVHLEANGVRAIRRVVLLP